VLVTVKMSHIAHATPTTVKLRCKYKAVIQGRTNHFSINNSTM